MDQQRIGQFIKVLRKEQELTQQDLADKLGVTNRAVSKWENGLSLPDYSIIGELSKLLNVSINEILSGEKLKEEERSKKFEENVMKTIKKNNKLKKFNYTFLIIVLLLLLVLGYVGYKMYLIKVFRINEFNEMFSNAKINYIHENIENTVKGNTILTDWDHDEPYKQKNISYYIPEEYKLTKNIDDGAESYCDTYVKKNSKGEKTGEIKICGHYGAHINVDLSSDILDYKEVGRLVNKYNINNVVDLIKYYEKNNKINIFTSSDQIKMIGLIVENEIFDSLGDIVNVHTLTGGLYGYYISIDNEYLDEEDFFGNESIYVSNEKLNNFLKIEFDDYETTKDKWNKEFSDFIHSIKFDEEIEYNYNEEE